MKDHRLRVNLDMNLDPDSPSLAEEQIRLQRFVYAMQVTTPRVWVTQAIVAVNVVVYLWMVITGYDLLADSTSHVFLEEGANYGPRTIGHGESWRLLTSMFLHGPIYHIGLNMWVLWLQGKLVERMMGNSNYAIMYLASGLLGSLASVYMNPDTPSIGASGAIFGVIGAMASLLYRHRAQFPKEMRRKLIKDGAIFIAANIAFGASIPNIDHAAHLGGLIAGMASGWYLGHPMTREGIAGRTARGLKLSVISALLIIAGGSVYPIERMEVPLGNEEMKPHVEALDTLRADSLTFAKDLDEKRLGGQLTPDAAAESIRIDLLPRWRKFRENLNAIEPATGHGIKLQRAIDDYAAISYELWGELALDVRGRLVGRERFNTLVHERDAAEAHLIKLWRSR